MMSKTKKPRSEKQLANDRRLAEAAKARKKDKEATVAAPIAPELPEEDFEPTEVREARLAREAKEAREGAELREPEVKEDAELTDVLPEDNQPLPTPQPQAQIDVNTVTAIAVAVAQALQQNPQIATATPEQKFEEIESTNPTPNARNQQHSARLGAGGEVQGVVFRYNVDKNYYPDPTERLLGESRLARFAMKENFIFRWSVDGVEYKKNNITYAEPRFTLELFRRLYDDNGEPTGKAALVARQMLHEDEFTTRIMAMRMGIMETFEDNDEGFRALMSEIRYRRFQEWLFGIFTPPKVQTFRRQAKTMVIDGKAQEVYDTEELTDHDKAMSQTATLQSQAGVGNVAVPGVE